MKRLLFILCLIFSAEVFAQHYTIEYWFDQNYGSHTTMGVDTSNLQLLIDVAHLGGGMHVLNLQARDTAGTYSNPMSFLFLNSMNIDSVEYVYWFDQNYVSRQVGNTSGGNLLFNTDSLRGGLHTFNFQFGDEDAAELHSYIFYKTSSPDSIFANMGYVSWFDQKYAGKQEGAIGSGNLLLDTDSLSSGLHAFNLQLGTGAEAELHSYIFYKTSSPDSTFANMEYVCWFDQDYDGRQIGTLGNGSLLINTDSLVGGLHMFNLQIGSGRKAELHSYIFYRTSSPDSIFANMGYVCWFDQDYANKQTGIIGDGNMMFNVDSLTNGWHTYNLQLGEGMDAELHSYIFYKVLDYDSIFRNTEYVRWFDQDYANRVTGVVDSGNILIDISTLSRGPHYLNYQFGEGENAELHTFLFYKVDTFYDTAYLDVCDWALWYDSTYTVSGNYGQEREAILPNCYDTVATLYLNVRYSSIGDTSATVCDSFLWYGNTYTESGLPVHHTTNTVGCDSTITLNLTVLYSTLGDTTAIVCDSFMWYGNTYTVSDTPQYHTTNLAECDSTITLNLTVNYSTLGDTMAFVCDSFMWHGITYTADSMPLFHTLNSLGCDSTITLDLVVHYSTEGDTTATACDYFEWNGAEYYASSDGETYTLTNAVGCDSVVTLHLTVNHSTIDTLVISTTESYEWQGNIYDTSGVYVDSLLTTAGCDSVLVLQLTIMQGIREVGNNMITVYPNPTSGKVKVDSDEVTRIDVYNVNGQLVKSVFKDSVVDISSLPSGVYTLKVETIQSTFVCRVVKQ